MLWTYINKIIRLENDCLIEENFRAKLMIKFRKKIIFERKDFTSVTHYLNNNYNTNVMSKDYVSIKMKRSNYRIVPIR